MQVVGIQWRWWGYREVVAMLIEARTPANPSGGTDGYVALPDARAERVSPAKLPPR